MSFFNTPILLIGPANTFVSGLNAGYIYAAALVCIVVTAALVIATYHMLAVKKKKFLFRTNIANKLEEWITEVIINDSSSDFTVPADFTVLFQNPEARQMLIDELVRNKGSFLGNVSNNIIKLYCQLGLNVDSRKKLDDKQTHIQCQGIHELCVMEQKDQLKKVYRFTNSENNDVRIEAQTALLQWYGFKGLRFLDVASYPITDFQQLKLLELLRQLPFEGLPKLNKWLKSNNDTIVNFALKLAEHYAQVQALTAATHCLGHPNEAVRRQAVKTLAVIGNASTAQMLTTVYENETFTNRLNILKELPKIAGDDQRDFLIVQLHEGHEYLKLASAKALATSTTEGMEILEAKAYDEPAPYHDIYLHIKSETSR